MHLSFWGKIGKIVLKYFPQKLRCINSDQWGYNQSVLKINTQLVLIERKQADKKLDSKIWWKYSMIRDLQAIFKSLPIFDQENQIR